MVMVNGQRQGLRVAALWVSGVVVLLTLVGVLWLQPAIETDLLQRARQAAVAAGLPAEVIRFDGRDAILAGSISNEAAAARLQTVVSNVYGVRAVSNRLVPLGTVPDNQATPAAASQPIGLATPAKRGHPIERLDLSAVQFPYGRADLGELGTTALQALDQVAALLKQQPNLVVEVSAHTDSQGSALGNQIVTQERAEAIRHYLLAAGAGEGQVVARGYGASRPLVEETDGQQRQRNRRVEIVVLKE